MPRTVRASVHLPPVLHVNASLWNFYGYFGSAERLLNTYTYYKYEDIYNNIETPRQTLDILERLCPSSRLEVTRNTPCRSGRSVWGEGILGISAPCVALPRLITGKNLKHLVHSRRKHYSATGLHLNLTSILHHLSLLPHLFLLNSF